MDNNDFRFSASYASRYNNCHGSANLSEAIPGFEYPERNNDGMKGEGTRLHKIFQEALSDPSNLLEKAVLLDELAELWGPKRTAYLEQSEKTYIVNWFLKHKTAPPFELSVLKEGLLQYVPALDTDGNQTKAEDGSPIFVARGVPPRRIAFIAEALRYVNDVIKTMSKESLEVLVEVKRTATWLSTRPKTTVDLIIRDDKTMHVMDLKMGDIEVSPIRNEQLMYYAATFDAFEYERVTLHILQRNYTDWWHLPLDLLREWVTTVQASERAIASGDLTLTPGEHCKFCPANPHGRGDKGNKACPAMMVVLYGERDQAESDAAVLEGDDNE